ncbi:MAG: glucose-6-phosphate dehydrogenase, partial [Gammaproteobacteria bacterium]|nr:glucose-6-phosphate dehydrogenase [Gammaproteobacteria bacterium]
MPLTFVIFGASGDLTSRKLIPALFRLHSNGRLPEPVWMVGCSLSELSDDEWRERLLDSTRKFSDGPIDDEQWRRFARQIVYQPLDIATPADFDRLSERLSALEQGQTSTRIFYLATAPSLYEPAALALGSSGLGPGDPDTTRLVIEKPFGIDQSSARKLNETLHSVFAEKQIYRIDHYLGKETVQNLLVLRFANSIFEPVWNRNYIDHVQITVAEEVSVG